LFNGTGYDMIGKNGGEADRFRRTETDPLLMIHERWNERIPYPNESMEGTL
jgi:hypothetical protein